MNWRNTFYFLFNRCISDKVFRGVIAPVAIIVALLIVFPVQGNTQSYQSPWISDHNLLTRVIAWSDIDGDGDLDLVVGNGDFNLSREDEDQGSIQIFRNTNGKIEPDPIWEDRLSGRTVSIALGDFDNDGAVDFVAGNFYQPNRIYRNTGLSHDGKPTFSRTDLAGESDCTRNVAWGDVNGDGYLDIVIGNTIGDAGDSCGTDEVKDVNKLYLYEQQTKGFNLTWKSTEQARTRAVALGDFDNDGLLDLAVGNHRAKDKVYLNTGGTFADNAIWESAEEHSSDSMVWGDMNQDGFLDLVVGSQGWSDKVYLNTNQGLSFSLGWQTNASDLTKSIALGDMNGDGTLDLVTGNSQGTSKIYYNYGDASPDIAGVTLRESDVTQGVALGDVDGDGDLDMALGNIGLNSLYRNSVRTLRNISESAATEKISLDVAWGDVDGDGDLDLALANGDGPVQVFTNEKGQLNLTSPWQSTDLSFTYSVAWGDVDGDGDLDLAVGNASQNFAIIVYYNENAELKNDRVWTVPGDTGRVTSVAWGDMDGDGDLDLAAGYARADDEETGKSTIMVYRNEQGQLAEDWESEEQDKTTHVMWGDVDRDGDLDLVTANLGTPDRIYENQGGILATQATWSSTESDNTEEIALGDLNGDGFLDLVAVGRDMPVKIYFNHEGALQQQPERASQDSHFARSVALVDIDNDRDLDLTVGTTDRFYWDSECTSSSRGHIKLYLNEKGQISPVPAWISTEGYNTQAIAWGDVNGDGRSDLAAANSCFKTNSNPDLVIYHNPLPAVPAYAAVPTIKIHQQSNAAPTFSGGTSTLLAPADFNATAAIRASGRIEINYSLFHPNGERVREVRGFYSLDGGGEWHTAIATSDTATTDLATAPYPNETQENSHIFVWDVFASQFFGQSDNVIFRLEVLPSLHPHPNRAAGAFQRLYNAAQTYPFRVRGTQIRVLDADGRPVRGALVYRQFADGVIGYHPIKSNGQPARTSPAGYLEGYGVLSQNERLVALAPISNTPQYTLYRTSATPTTEGINPGGAGIVMGQGVQTLTVSPDHPLLVFQLNVSLEWDASQDDVFLSQLEQNLYRTSQLIYDWTNGQVALGAINIYQDKQRWDDVDIRIYASNQLRPTADRGGIVQGKTVLDHLDFTVPITVTRGEVRIGPQWNRYGDMGTLGDDWPNVLAHELGHYLLFLEDTYLGLDEDGLLIPVETCINTAMTDPYDESSSEFHYDYARDVNSSLDWYREDFCGNTLAELPEWELITLAYEDLHAPTAINPGPNLLPIDLTGMMIHATPTESPPRPPLLVDDNVPLGPDNDKLAAGRAYLIQAEQRLIDLGRPIIGSIKARGARDGDELCLFASENFACATLENGVQPQLVAQPRWQAEILLTPVSTTTLQIQVNATDANALTAVIYPGGSNPQTINLNVGVSHTVILDAPATEALIDIRGSEAKQRLITGYAIGSGPGRIRSYGGPGRIRSYGGPVTSGDGSLVIYPPANLVERVFMTLQTVASLPAQPPAGLQPIGRAYHLRPSEPVADYTGGSLAFYYLGIDVALSGVPEQNLALYHWNGAAWQRLVTKLNTRQNIASAPMAGPGIYSLMTGFGIPLDQGWNLVAYPLQEMRATAEALQSIDGDYTIIVGYDATNPAQPWKIYDPNAPSAANDLDVLQPGAGYWIYAERPTIWRISPGNNVQMASSTASPPLPPARFYGRMNGNDSLTPTADLPVMAYIDETLCGEGQTWEIDGQIVYIVDVWAADHDDRAGCGTLDRQVTIMLDGDPLFPPAPWQNASIQILELSPQGAGELSSAHHIYLPLVSK